MEGNQKKTREALVALRDRFNNNVMAYQDRFFKFSGWHWHKKAAEAARWRDVFQELKEVCDAALSAPPRNCDVGTAEDQYERLLAHCRRTPHCTGCEVFTNHLERCEFRWAQLPYAAEEGAGE